MTANNMENDFEREPEDERKLKTDEVPPSQVRGAPEPSLCGPTQSEYLTTSVLDRIG